MADNIELVIKIPKEEYSNILKSNNSAFADYASKECMMYAIKNGTPLPKGHGRLIDCERLQEVFRRNVVGYAGFKQLFDIAPTIIDKSESEEKNEKRNC